MGALLTVGFTIIPSAVLQILANDMQGSKRVTRALYVVN